MLINVMEHPNNINNNVEIISRPQSIGLPPLTVDVNCNGPLCPDLSVTPSNLQLSPGFLEIPSNDILLLKTIGKGSFGVVYKARWNGSGGGRIIAVKKVETDTELSAFYNEIKQLSRVTHDNIVQMYGITSTKAAKCLIMEFADGGSLYQFLHCPPYSSYNISHALSWLLQCAKAIAYLHAIQPVPIIHRDLKPLNMLLSNRKRVLKICDFGTACDLRSVMTDNRGSTAWMAPEVIRGGKYNEKCDVHSWGMILWEVLTRRIPFEELGQPYRILWQIVNHVRPPKIQGCPVPLEKLMQSCWLDEHGARPTMQEVVDTIYPLCKLMNAADEANSFSSSSNDSFTESCVSLINEGSSIDHTSRDISEFTNSTNTIDLPLIDEHASLANETPLNSGNLAVADSRSSTGNIHLHLPQVTISPNVSASVIVGVENLLPPWGSATSDEINSHSNNSAQTTPKESSDSLLHTTNEDSSPFVLVDTDTSPFIFPVPVPASDVLPTICNETASLKNVSPSKSVVSPTPILNAFSPSVFKPLQISIPNSGPPERTDVDITTSQVTTSVLYSNAGASLVKPSVSISPRHRMGQMDNSQVSTCVASNGINSNYLLPAVTYASLDQLVASPILTSPPLTSVATSLTLVPPIRYTPKDSLLSQNDNLKVVTLRQNLTANDPEAAFRRRSTEVPFHSTCQKRIISGQGHRRSSSYESKELIGFEPLANEVLLESSMEDRYSNPALALPFKNFKETFSNENINQDEGRLKEDPLSPRNPPLSPNTPGAAGFTSGQPQSFLQRTPPYNLPVSSSGGSGTPAFSQYPTRGGLQTPLTTATTRGSTIALPLNIRGVSSPSGRAPNVIPYKKGIVGGGTSDVLDDSGELGALWELLDDDLKPAMPIPLNHHSQQIFDDHKSLAHQLLVVQEEIVFLDQEKNKLRMKLKDQETEQIACKKRYKDKIIDLQSKNETLHLNHSRLAQQIDEIRSRNCHRGSESWSPNQTTPPQTRSIHSPNQRLPSPNQRLPSPHQVHSPHLRTTTTTTTTEGGHWSPLHHPQQPPHYPQLHHSPRHHYNEHSVNNPHPKH